MKAKVENGKILGFYIGIENQDNLIDVPDYVTENLNNFNYINGKFIEKDNEDKLIKIDIEKRVEELEQLVADLASLQLGV